MHIKLDLRDSLTKHGADPMTQPEFARFVVSEPESAAIIITLGKQPNYYRVARQPRSCPALSEPGVKVSLHPAQALRTPL
jgi:hypothetical protein